MQDTRNVEGGGGLQYKNNNIVNGTGSVISFLLNGIQENVEVFFGIEA